MYPDLKVSKVFLMHLNPSGASVSVLIFCNSSYESLSHPRCEKMDLNIIQALLERVQIHKNAVKPKY